MIDMSMGSQDPAKTLRAFLEVKLELTRQFAELIRQETVLERVELDDELFSEIISQAVSEYGVRQAKLAEALKVSVAAVSRWAGRQSLPARYYRRNILEALHGLLAASLPDAVRAPDRVAQGQSKVASAPR
jgi:ribosome-binding protein aMBF1 (putative translation factor)